MSVETIIIWIVVGGIAGLLADSLVKSVKLGLLAAVVVGILGAFIGGWLFTQMGVSIGGGIIGTIFVAFIGAVVLLLIVGAIRRR